MGAALPSLVVLRSFDCLLKRTTFAGLEDVGIHGQTHAAPRFPPLKPCFDETDDQALPLRLVFSQVLIREPPWHAPARQPVFPLRYFAAMRRSSIRELVQDPINTRSIFIWFMGVPGFESHITESFFGSHPNFFILQVPRMGNFAIHPCDHGRVRSPCHLRGNLLGLQPYDHSVVCRPPDRS